MNLLDSQSSLWSAELELGFDFRHGKTVMSHNRHEGPLVVQKALYPEGPKMCQILIIHPPGGIAGGDVLKLTCDLGAGANAQFTTPGATKWYESFERPSKQSTIFNVKSNSVCEWMPQENIIFNKCLADMEINVNVETGGVFVGWDFCALGRHIDHAPLLEGRLKQKINISVDGVSKFLERTIFSPDQFMDGPGILDDFSNFGTMAVVGLEHDKILMDELRGIAKEEAHCGITYLNDVLIIRWVGGDIERGRQVFTNMWVRLRPLYSSHAAVTPRIWNT